MEHKTTVCWPEFRKDNLFVAMSMACLPFGSGSGLIVANRHRKWGLSSPIRQFNTSLSSSLLLQTKVLYAAFFYQIHTIRLKVKQSCFDLYHVVFFPALCDQLSFHRDLRSALYKVQTQTLLAPTTAHPSDRVTDQPRAAPFKKRNRWRRRKRGISGGGGGIHPRRADGAGDGGGGG